MPGLATQGPLTAAVSYTTNQAQAAYAYGKENISVVNYVACSAASKVEAPANKVLSTVEPYSTSAVSFVDGCLVKTHEVVIEKPATLASAAYTGAVKNIDAGIESYLPSVNGTEPSKNPSVVGCVGKVYGRLPAKIAAAPGAAATFASPTFTQVCTETGRVMHTTISTVQGQTTATFHLIADGVHTKIAVPIHSGLVKLNDTLKISEKAQYTADLVGRALQPILNNSLVVAISEKVKQLEATVCPNLRAAIEAQMKTLVSIISVSSMPVSQVRAETPSPAPVQPGSRSEQRCRTSPPPLSRSRSRLPISVCHRFDRRPCESGGPFFFGLQQKIGIATNHSHNSEPRIGSTVATAVSAPHGHNRVFRKFDTIATA
jgi:hypothetical protein